MRNSSFTVSTADLNTHAIQTLDVSYTETMIKSGITDSYTFFPKKLQIINNTGINIKMNIISSQDELDLYNADPTRYDLFTVLNNTTVVFTPNTILPPVYKLLIQAPSGTASAALVVEAIGFQPKL